MRTSKRVALLTATAVAFGSVLLTPIPSRAANEKDVVVVNDSADPVPTEDVDNPDRQPFQTFGNANNFSTTTIAFVPPDKRLVIEFFSASCNSTGTEPTVIRVQTSFPFYFSLQN